MCTVLYGALCFVAQSYDEWIYPPLVLAVMTVQVNDRGWEGSLFINYPGDF